MDYSIIMFYTICYRYLGGSFLQLLSILVLGSVPPSRLSQGASRYILTCWSIIALVLTTSFSSGLVTHLTSMAYTPKIETIQGFLDNKYFWSFDEVPDFTELFDVRNVMHMRWRIRAVITKSEEERIKMIKNKKHVLYGGQIQNGFFLADEDIPEEILKDYEVVKNCFMEYFPAFAFRKGSPFEPCFDNYIRTYSESGLAGKIIQNHLQNYSLEHPSTYEVLRLTKNKLAKASGLTVGHLTGIFEFFAAGMFFSIVVFLLELCQLYKKF